MNVIIGRSTIWSRALCNIPHVFPASGRHSVVVVVIIIIIITHARTVLTSVYHIATNLPLILAHVRMYFADH